MLTMRTRPASPPPPSPRSFGAVGRLWVLACLVMPVGSSREVRAQEPQYVFANHNILPSGIPISQEQILKMLVPDYQEKLRSSQTRRANQSDLNAEWHRYEASIISFRRTNLGIRGEDFLIVSVEEVEDDPCDACHFTHCRFSVFGGVDLKRVAGMGSFRSDDPSVPGAPSLVLDKSERPWKLRLRYGMGDWDASGRGVGWERAAVVEKGASAGWHLEFGDVLKRIVQTADLPAIRVLQPRKSIQIRMGDTLTVRWKVTRMPVDPENWDLYVFLFGCADARGTVELHKEKLKPGAGAFRWKSSTLVNQAAHEEAPSYRVSSTEKDEMGWLVVLTLYNRVTGSDELFAHLRTCHGGMTDEAARVDEGDVTSWVRILPRRIRAAR